MARSHPPTLLRLVERCLTTECGLAPGDGLLLGVSGGPDSMALLDVLGRLAPRLRFSLFACGVDHGLRSAAGAELSLAEAHACSLGVPFFREAVVVDGTRNVQAGARAARYAALRHVAASVSARFVVTAHHADDRAETVLLRLLRGAGPRGLAVLEPRSGDLLRPMIHARRADVRAHLERHRVAFAEDPSNSDERFLRTRVRHELIPLLKSLSPEIVTHLVTLAEQLSAWNEDEGVSVATARDASGETIPLNREQAAQVRHARAKASKGNGARLCVPLTGGRDLVLDPRTGAAVVLAGARPPSSRPGTRGLKNPPRSG